MALAAIGTLGNASENSAALALNDYTMIASSKAVSRECIPIVLNNNRCLRVFQQAFI